MKTMVRWSLATVALLVVTPLTVLAQHPGRVWRGDIRHFERHDAHQWRSGAWRHGSHGGRIGWWWVAGGMWYFYPQPVYPYPDPYRPPLVVVESSPPPPVVMQIPAPAAPQIPSVAAQPATQFWYYCEPARGYYPYVASCPSGWKTVPATPPGTPQ
jgi:hypothetical protein